MELTANKLEDLALIAKEIITTYPTERIFLFYGNMGAGKTTLINSLCQYLEVLDHTSSPTFSIVNEYNSKNGPIYHFDFYRLKTETEALDMGYEEYFYSGNYCFVEWPEKINNLLPDNYIKLNIQSTTESQRKIIVEKK